jgi:hypothetical protein
MPTPQPYLTVASILSGFSISVFMFRIQRELRVRDDHPDWPNWLAWADYLILEAILLSLLLVVLPLMAIAEPGRLAYSVAAGSCAAASILVAAYPFAILDHYRIEIGTWRTRGGSARKSDTKASRSNALSCLVPPSWRPLPSSPS